MTTIQMGLKRRSAVDSSDCWNVAAIFPSFSSWEKEYASVLESTHSPHWPSLARFKGHLGESPIILREALDCFLDLSRKLEKLYTYAHLRHDEEITLDTHKSNYQKITSLLHDLQQESAWLEPEILSLPPDLIDQYLRNKELTHYRFYLEKIIRKRPHTLSADKEELLAMAQKPLKSTSSAFSALNNADLKFPEVKDTRGKAHPLTHSLFSLYLRSPDRELRKNAFINMHNSFLGYENTLCELLSGNVKAHYFEAKARNFSSCLEAALFPNNIPISVYETLIKTVRKHLKKLHRYVGLRKKILKVEELHLYDMYVPLVSEVKLEIDYPKAEKLVIESVAPLGKEYQKILKRGLQEERWVDRFENENKRSGAYSSGCFDSYPYILMNYNMTVRDAFTLAHEAGHSMHSYLSNSNQPYHYAHYPIFVAEIASTFNEELLMDLLLNQLTKKEEQLFLINEKVENMRATLFRQTMFAEFELTIHKFVENNQPLTPSLLKETYINLNKEYFGPEIVIDEEIAIEWARIPHFYYNFYVYQYATGISAALALADKLHSHDPHIIKNYLTFLQSGSTLFPIDLLKIAGIDLTTDQPFEAALNTFDKKISQLEHIFLR